MKRQSTHPAGKGLGLGRVFTVGACLLAVCISQAVVASAEQVFAGYNKHYDACVIEAIEASPNTNEESRTFFRDIVPKTFVFTYVSNIKNIIKKFLFRTRSTDDIVLKYLQFLMTKTLSDLEDKDFSKVVAEKCKELRANFVDHKACWPALHLTPDANKNQIAKAYFTFDAIVSQSYRDEDMMEDFFDHLRQNSKDENMSEKMLDNGTLSVVKALIKNHIERLEVLSKHDLVFKEFTRAMTEKPTGTGSPQPLHSLACYNDHYNVCVDEAIEASPNRREESETVLRLIVSETFSDRDLLFNFIDNLKRMIDSKYHPDDKTSLDVNDILFKYVELLMSKIISDVEGTDFSKVIAEKWTQLGADYGSRYKLYRRPWLIPGCRSTNQESRDIFQDIVTKTLETKPSMSKYIEDLRENSKKAKIPDKKLSDEVISDVETLMKRYIVYMEGITTLGLLLEEFARVFGDEDKDAPRRLLSLDVATCGQEVLATYKNLYNNCIDEVIEASPNMDEASHNIFRAKVQENVSTKDLMYEYLVNLPSSIVIQYEVTHLPLYLDVGRICTKYLGILLTKIVTDLEDKDFSKIVAEEWQQLKANFRDIKKITSKDFTGNRNTNEESQDIFNNIVKSAYNSNKTLQDYFKDIEEKSVNAKVSSDTTRSDLNTIIKKYMDDIEAHAKCDVVIRKLASITSAYKDGEKDDIGESDDDDIYDVEEYD